MYLGQRRSAVYFFIHRAHWSMCHCERPKSWTKCCNILLLFVSSLRHLCVRNCSFSNHGIHRLVLGCQRLTSLDISYNRRLTACCLSQISRHLDNLERISFCGRSHGKVIVTSGFKRFLNLPRLKKIGLTFHKVFAYECWSRVVNQKMQYVWIWFVSYLVSAWSACWSARLHSSEWARTYRSAHQFQHSPTTVRFCLYSKQSLNIPLLFPRIQSSVLFEWRKGKK